MTGADLTVASTAAAAGNENMTDGEALADFQTTIEVGGGGGGGNTVTGVDLTVATHVGGGGGLASKSTQVDHPVPPITLSRGGFARDVGGGGVCMFFVLVDQDVRTGAVNYIDRFVAAMALAEACFDHLLTLTDIELNNKGVKNGLVEVQLVRCYNLETRVIGCDLTV